MWSMLALVVGCVGREEGTDVDSVDPCQLNSQQCQFEVPTWEGTTYKGMKDPLRTVNINSA